MAQCLQDGGSGADDPRRRRGHRARCRTGEGDECNRGPARRDLIGANLAASAATPHFRAGPAAAMVRAAAGSGSMMATEHSVGFEPADRLAKDRESVRRRFWTKFKRVVASLP